MFGGTFPGELLAQLPPALREDYDVDSLLVADFDGVLRWAVRIGSEISLGAVIGELFAETVLTTWSQTWPEQYMGPA